MLISPRAEKLFGEALALAPELRAEFLREACPQDQELYDEVYSLIQAATQSEHYFDELSGQVGLTALTDDIEQISNNKEIGQWRLLRLLGRGGMGSVYLAERADGQFEKRVAIKILPIGFDNELARLRFLTERQILAQLVHDNIARLLDGGVTEEGTPYFVMDFVEGTPIDAYCDQHELTIRQRLYLLLDVALGVQFAHRNLIIHRDLKPNNVLVESNGRARLLDFGIAKALDSGDNAKEFTQMANRPVTPAYASPQMLKGEPVDVTTDVYSLGVILYKLLSGHLPLDFEGLSTADMYTHVTTKTPAPVSRLNHKVDNDLDAIVGKALAKLPSERYQSVESLAQDIRNYLNGLPVLAKAPSAWYRFQKFISRHRVGAAFAVLSIVGLTAFALLAGYSAINSERQTRAIGLERDRAQATKDFLINIFDAADPNVSGADITAKQILDSGRKRINNELSDQPTLQADLLNTMGTVYSRLGLLEEWQSVLFDELNMRAKVEGTDSLNYLDAVIRLSQVEDLRGDYKSSELHANEALQLSLKLDHALSEAAARNRVGRIQHLQGNYDQADEQYRRSLVLYRQQLGDEHMDTAQVKLHLATLLDHQSRHQDAHDLIIEVVATHENLKNKDHSIPTDLYLTYGRILNKLKRHEEAIAIYERTLASNEKLYGVDNMYNLYIVNGLGKIAEDMGDYSSAIIRYQDTVRLLKIHAPDSPNVGRANSNLARAYQLTNQCDLAIEPFHTAINIFQLHLPDHWFMGEAKARLGRCLVQKQRYEEAEQLISEGLELLTSRWDKKQAVVDDARATAVQLYEAWGKPELAQAYK